MQPMTAWEPGARVRIVEGERVGTVAYLVERTPLGGAWVVRIPGQRKRFVYLPSSLERVT